jgi:hypothetical protein
VGFPATICNSYVIVVVTARYRYDFGYGYGNGYQPQWMGLITARYGIVVDYLLYSSFLLFPYSVWVSSFLVDPHPHSGGGVMLQDDL